MRVPVLVQSNKQCVQYLQALLSVLCVCVCVCVLSASSSCVAHNAKSKSAAAVSVCLFLSVALDCALSLLLLLLLLLWLHAKTTRRFYPSIHPSGAGQLADWLASRLDSLASLVAVNAIVAFNALTMQGKT